MTTLGTLRAVTDGTVAGDHPPPDYRLNVLVGPATETQFNTIRPTVIPVACWRADDVTFEFGSSFPLPEVAPGLAHLHTLIGAHTDKSVTPHRPPPASIFGHADPVGDDEFNKKLSGRRARAVYAMLVRDTGAWEQLHIAESWGTRTTQVMLNHLGHDCGREDGVSDKKTADAIKMFQAANGLSADGVAGPQTRKKLFEKYMDALCQDAQGAPFTLDKQKNFLAGGADAQGKGDYQGCSEFNPVLLFSRAEDEKFRSSQDKSVRNRENAPNRRVMILLFRPGSSVEAARWPCPRASEGSAKCRERFWSDHQRRVALGEERRLWEKTQDTYACRFYHRLTDRSPCERLPPPPLGMAYLAVRVFFDARPMHEVFVQFHRLDGRTVGAEVGEPVLTNDDGLAVLRQPVIIGNYVCVVEHQRPKVVCTVFDASRAEIIVLPVGRPYQDVDGHLEYLPPEGAE
jgi:hypothetical protein